MYDLVMSRSLKHRSSTLNELPSRLPLQRQDLEPLKGLEEGLWAGVFALFYAKLLVSGISLTNRVLVSAWLLNWEPLIIGNL